MYLTKMLPVVGDDYEVHRKVMERFERPQRVLFQHTPTCLYVLSERPSSRAVGRQAEVDVDKLSLAGEQHFFSLRLNAARRSPGGGKRVSIPLPKMREWVSSKFARAGVEADFDYSVEGTRRSRKGEATVSLQSVMVTGVLTVKDSSAFKQALCSGIGHAKGFGFGMLNVFSF